MVFAMGGVAVPAQQFRPTEARHDSLSEPEGGGESEIGSDLVATRDAVADVAVAGSNWATGQR